ncbi:erythromycin esterase [Neolewinella xylanilytica]|uniref:Erythromycin esterase n=1 Tax=Neolewinella xylanilytica TaxID=1514080 RepID=A0A2S6I4N7_9BACT|nr:erythromycin esterase family protein [Neolewinella xylanilytica]PPK86120.1 erythromycin esterase [Neolewinella xylanilytica]
MPFLIILLTFLIGSTGWAQGDLNLDFERQGPEGNLPGGWFFGGPNYSTELSTKDPASGARCLTIRSVRDKDSTYAAISTRLPASLVAGQVIRLEGMIRAAMNSEYDTAGYLARVDHESRGTIAFSHTYDQPLGQPGDWTTVSLELTVPEEAAFVMFGGVFGGRGELSFDALQLFIDGEPYDIKKNLAVSPTRPDDPRLEWLRQYVHPLRSTAADYPTTTDLAAFGAAVGERAVVGLGESTHGSHEIFTLKDRLWRYLHQHHDFRTFVLEGPLIPSYAVNDYLETGEESVPELLKDIGYWPWQTEEVVELIEGMRHAPGEVRPRFTGMDMQNYTQAWRILEGRFGDDAELLADLVELRSKLDLVRFNRHEGSGYLIPDRYLEVVNRVIPKLNAAIAEANLSARDTRWLSHMVRLIEQFVDQKGILRDGYLAENVEWIRSVEDYGKAVVWAHNQHVLKVDGRMGEHLAKSLGSDYVAVGFAFAGGQYTHSRHGVKETVEAENPYPATYEYWFDRLDEPMFYLDLREMAQDTTPYADWFRHELQFRKVGTVKPWSEFGKENLTEAYDMIFFVGTSSPSRVLPIQVLYGYE